MGGRTRALQPGPHADRMGHLPRRSALDLGRSEQIPPGRRLGAFPAGRPDCALEKASDHARSLVGERARTTALRTRSRDRRRAEGSRKFRHAAGRPHPQRGFDVRGCVQGHAAAPAHATGATAESGCAICKDRIAWVDYKDVNMLRKYMSDRGKIRARRVSGNCAQHQRDVALAIKTARELVLLPYTQRTTTERPGARGGRGGRGDRDGGFSGGQGASGRGRPRSDSDEEQGRSSGAGSAPAGDTVAAPTGESATGADVVATDAAGEDAAMTAIATEAEAEVVGAESEG